jgi:uncharacterized membrane protein
MMINWAGVTSVFLLSTIKFLFAPFAGVPLNLHFYETYFAAVSGATLSAAIFYFGSERLMEFIKANKGVKSVFLVKKEIVKKKFTRSNKFIVKLRMRFGKIGICFFAPLFLSIPLGSIISAKFYGRDNNTFLFIFVGLLLNGALTTFLAYVIFK